jgi:F-type H+-transporting ATPase subunit b
MFSVNGTYVVFIALFVMFIYLLNEIMLKPVGAAMDKRRAKLRENLAVASTCTQEAQKILADYENKLHASRLEAQGIIQTALNTAQKERDKKLKSIQAEGRAKVEEMKNELAADRQNLLKSLIHPELELVSQIIEKLLGQKESVPVNEEKVLQTLQDIG